MLQKVQPPRLVPIPSQLKREIDVALKCYFEHPSSLCAAYWPRPFRDFLRALLLKVLASDLLTSERLNVKCEDVKSLADDLAKPTSFFINAARRKLALLLLRQLQLSPNPVVASMRLALPVYEDDAGWPGDICGFEDLKMSLSSHALRGDVEMYIFNLVEGFLQDQPFALNFAGFDPCAKDVSLPIEIEVHPDNVVRVRNLIDRESKKLTCEGLVPPFSAIASRVNVHEEGFHTSALGLGV